MDIVSKVSETSVKVTTTIDQIVSLKTVKIQREETIKQLENLDKQYQEQRANTVSVISKLDHIIAEAGKSGVIDEVKVEPIVAAEIIEEKKA